MGWHASCTGLQIAKSCSWVWLLKPKHKSINQVSDGTSTMYGFLMALPPGIKGWGSPSDKWDNLWDKRFRSPIWTTLGIELIILHHQVCIISILAKHHKHLALQHGKRHCISRLPKVKKLMTFKKTPKHFICNEEYYTLWRFHPNIKQVPLLISGIRRWTQDYFILNLSR